VDAEVGPPDLSVTMPPKKTPEERKQAITVSLEPQHRQWLRENFRREGFRNESHAVDGAIQLLIEARERKKD
jgi:hypothetical protein